MFKPFNIYMKSTDIVTQTAATTSSFRFTSNPTTVTTITATPSSSNFSCVYTPNPWSGTVASNGSVSGLNNTCAFMKGNWGTASDARFTVTFQSAGTASANLSGSSGSGTNGMQVSVDGGAPTSFSIPNNASTPTPSVAVPAGTHTIRFLNSGNDWLQVNNFSFTNVQLSKLQAYGYIGSQYAYGYVYDKSYGAWADPASVAAITTGIIRIGSLTPGSYQVDFFDPQAGTAFFGGGTYTSVNPNDSITVPLPSFKKDIAFRVTPTAPAPVELTLFTGELVDDKYTDLKWITGSEKNTAYFEIQRSTNGQNYIALHTTPASGNSTTSRDYSYQDLQPMPGANYYRLKIIDADGNYTYSHVVQVYTFTKAITTYPNPAGNVLNINIPAANTTDSKIVIVNSLGKEVLSENIRLHTGINIISLDISSLSASIYFIKISGAVNQQNNVIKFLKE